MRVAILGAGVSGLTCAFQLMLSAHSITIFAEKVVDGTASARAGAIWHPFKVSASKRTKDLATQTYNTLLRLAGKPETGVDIVQLTETISERSLPWWAKVASGAKIVQCGTELAIRVSVPFMTSTVYLRYLLERVQANGVGIQQTSIDSIRDLVESYDVVVNCTGLGAARLCSDSSLRPIRGVTLLVDRSSEPAECRIDDRDSTWPKYVFQRRTDTLIGGTAEDGRTDSSVPAEMVQRILDGAATLGVAKWTHSAIRQVSVGFRPYRPKLRLEIDSIHPRVIHNYGHGGSGFTLSWGCAAEVARYVNRIVHDCPSR